MSIMTKSHVLSALCAVYAILPSFAQFLAEHSVPRDQQILAKLKELHLGGDHEHIMPSDERIASLQQELSTIYSALPKNSRGALRPSTARYLLHRLFVQRHGWHFKGLAPEGDTWDSTSPTHILSASSRVPAAAHLHLVRLAAAYNALDLSLASQLNINESTAVLETYMASFVMGSDAQQLGQDASASKTTMLQKLKDVAQLQRAPGSVPPLEGQPFGDDLEGSAFGNLGLP
eukprot:Skav202333  [mRNA]  locus=scaffold781:56427:65054:+ [translate_table: standard]